VNSEIRHFLEKLEEHGKAHDSGESSHARRLLNLEAETAELVSILAQSLRAKRILEIGTSNGYSTIWLADAARQAGGSVISIDRSAEKHAMARENLLRAGLLKYVDLQLGDATGIAKMLPGPFDFVFFDADRTSAPGQLAHLLPKLTTPALILADNALSHPQEIADYLATISNLKDLQHVIVPVGKGLSVAYIPAR
jgi:predicted O-methyltransferase YrrM